MRMLRPVRATVLAVRLVPPSRRMALKIVAVRLLNKWCGRPDLNRHGPLGPTDFHPTSAFAAAVRRSWSGLSLHHGVSALGAARLVSTPSPEGAWLGIASEGFPEFGQFYTSSFLLGTQWLKSGASTIPPRPHTGFVIAKPGPAAKCAYRDAGLGRFLRFLTLIAPASSRSLMWEA